MVSLLPSGLILYVPAPPPAPSPWINSVYLPLFFSMKRFGPVDEGHGENLDHPRSCVDDFIAATFQNCSTEYSVVMEMFYLYLTYPVWWPL